MKKGFLSQYFSGVAIKKLRPVEVDTQRSNQHEFNGGPLRNLLGDVRLNEYPVTFIWLGDENEGISIESQVTWYDARERHPIRSEWRLYFKSNPVMDWANEGDLLIVAKKPDNQIYMIVVKSDSTFENQLLWLFGLNEDLSFSSFSFQSIEEEYDPKVDFAVRYILEELGIEIQDPDSVLLDRLIEPYIGIGFPSTREFSSLARESYRESCPKDNPDLTLLKWMEQEEKLFKRLERYMVKEKLEQGFYEDGNTNVESFIKFSLSVHNRRKSRVGHAFENHLEEILKVHQVKHSKGKITENKSKPDFVFPSISFYKDTSFPVDRLTVLGAKSTCKDRWRQVLAEADRVKIKHLITLEPGISENQTDEMKNNNLKLIIPKPLQETYNESQRPWLMSLEEFIQLVIQRQM